MRAGVFDHGDVKEQLVSIGAMVELMMMTEDAHKKVKGSRDDQNSPLTVELYTREDRRVHLEMDCWTSQTSRIRKEPYPLSSLGSASVLQRNI